MNLSILTMPVYLLLLAILVLLLVSPALAQDTMPGLPLPSSIPPEYQGVATLVIGLISAWLVQPATAIAKKLGRTTGPSTVGISAALSLVVAFGFAYAQASAAQSGLNVLGALTVALIAFVKSNGDYLVRVFASGKALSDAAVISALPAPGADGSPQTNGNEWSTTVGLPEVHEQTAAPLPFLGLPALPTLVGGVLASPLLEGAIKGVLAAVGLPPTAERVLQVAIKLGPDLLLDGNPQLSESNLAVINNVVISLMEAKKI